MTISEIGTFQITQSDRVILNTEDLSQKMGQRQFVDLDADGDLDIVTTGAVFTNEIWTGAADPGFILWNTQTGYVLDQGDRPESVLARELIFEDFNQDGVLDIFVADHGYDVTPFPSFPNQLLLSSEGGYQRAELPSSDFDFSHSATSGDFNNDGNIDILVGNLLEKSYFLMGESNGQFTLELTNFASGQDPNSFFDPNYSFVSCHAADINGDGWDDVVLGRWLEGQNTLLYLNDGAGTFDASTPIIIPKHPNQTEDYQALDIQTTDLNNDGRQDLVILYTPNYVGWALQTLIQQEDGSFLDETDERLGISKSGDAYWQAFFEFKDFNHDGHLDIVPTDYQYFSDQPIAWLNDGAGYFTHLTGSDVAQSGQEYFLSYNWNIVVQDDKTTIERFHIDGNNLNHGIMTQVSPTQVTERRLAGDTEDNTLTGGSGRDTLTGDAGNDTLTAGGGDDTIDGGADNDTAVFSGARSDYVVFTSNGITTVMDLATNRDGTDFLQNIENLTFSTETMTLAAAVAEPADADGSSYQIYRFFNTLTGSHFFTTSIEERNSVITNIPTMTYEGNSFDSNATEAGGGVAVHRFYNSDSGVHFYTASAAEAQSIQNSLPQFNYEGIAYYASETADAGGTALYRFFNSQSGSHFYTTSAEERDSIISTLGHYTYEGVAYYVDLA